MLQHTLAMLAVAALMAVGVLNPGGGDLSPADMWQTRGAQNNWCVGVATACNPTLTVCPGRSSTGCTAGPGEDPRTGPWHECQHTGVPTDQCNLPQNQTQSTCLTRMSCQWIPLGMNMGNCN